MAAKTWILTDRESVGEEQAGFSIRDRIENIGGTPQGYQILYHTNLGPPLLGPEAKLEAKTLSSRIRGSVEELTPEVWNRYGPPQAGKQEEVYFHLLESDENGSQEVVLSNPRGGIQASLRALQSELPYFTQWKNEADEADGYVTGLEFGTGYPTSRKEEREAGRFRILQPGESDEVGLSLNISILP